MPEAAVHEDHRGILRQNDIRLTGKVTTMEPKSKSGTVQIAPHNTLRLRVSRLDRSHVATARFWAMNVDHHTTMASCSSDSSVFCFIANRWGVIAFATASTTGTTTELPNCLYA